jgi:hypothetical protein
MRSISRSAACLLLAGACLPACWAQKWELGVTGGGGFYTHASVTAGTASGDVGFKPGAAFGAFLGNNTSNRWGGELHYTYQPGDLRVSSGGSEATFTGESHAINYDFLYHFAPMEAHIRPFVAFGGGAKLYRGTGSPTVTQPLSNLALLTNTHEVAGMGSVGAGFKVSMSPKLGLRFEVHDFLTPFPKQVIAAAPGATIGSFLNDFVVMGGISFTF